MQILSNLLPGLRDLRTPLATGYIVLASVLLAYFDRLGRWFVQSPVGSDLQAIAEYGGPTAVLAATSFAAYLIGSVWSEVVPPFLRLVARLCFLMPYFACHRRVIKWRIRRRTGLTDSVIAEINELDDKRKSSLSRRDRLRLRRLVVNRIQGAYHSTAALRDAVDGRLYPGEHQRNDLTIAAVEDLVDVPGHVTDIAEDSNYIPPRLLGPEPESWDSWDRLKSEAAFRLSISTALVPFVLAASISISRWAILLGSVSIALWVLGMRKAAAARSTLYEVLFTDRVSLPSLDRLTNPDQLKWRRTPRAAKYTVPRLERVAEEREVRESTARQ
jgi:hypothetical protein